MDARLPKIKRIHIKKNPSINNKFPFKNNKSAAPPISQGKMNSKKNSNRHLDKFSESDFEINENRDLSLNDNYFEYLQNLIDKGYFSFFLKINDYKPRFFICDKHVNLKLVLKGYIENTLDINKNIVNGIKLYCGKRPLNLDEELQYLNLKSYSIVKNIISEEETIFQS